MQAKLTKKEFIEWLKTSEGKQFNIDLWYAFQCFDYANAGWKTLFGLLLKGVGAKDIPFANNFDGLATVYQNTPDFLAQPGDMVVFGSNYGAGYGHVAWVIEATLDYIIVYEQNWLGGGWTDGIEQPGWGWEKLQDDNMLMISLCGLSVRILKVRQRHDQFNLLHKHLKRNS